MCVEEKIFSSDLFFMNLKQSMKVRESTKQYLKRLPSLKPERRQSWKPDTVLDYKRDKTVLSVGKYRSPVLALIRRKYDPEICNGEY